MKNAQIHNCSWFVGMVLSLVATDLQGQDVPLPTISDFSPKIGGTGVTVTITGTGFEEVTEVNFGGTVAASYEVISTTSIEAVVGVGSTGNVFVINTAGSATLSGFTFVESPVIESFDPTSAGVSATVTITGTNFTYATSVSFGGIEAQSFNVIDNSRIDAIVASGATGDVSVTTPGGIATLAGFSFIPAPEIFSFTPGSGQVGASVQIIGSNFGTLDNTTVMFNTSMATIESTTTTSIIAYVPEGATTGPITVYVNGQSATSDTEFTVEMADIRIINEAFISNYEQGSALTVSVTLNDSPTGTRANFLSRGISEAASVIRGVEVMAQGNKYEITVPASELNDPIGLVYSFEIIVPGRILKSSEVRANVYFTTATNQVIPNLSNGNQVSNYQIIAIPLNLGDKRVTSVFGSLMPYDKTQWRLFDYFNGDNREYSGFSNIEPGRGYWFIMRNFNEINPGAGSTVEISQESFSIPLASGWNLIGNPFNFRISWHDVRAFNNTPSLGDLKTFNNGILATTTVLDSYRGGFVFNSGGPVNLKIPVMRNTNIGGRFESQEATSDLNIDHWELPLHLSQGELSNQLGGIGMHPEAKLEGKDQFDQVSVPMIKGIGFFELGFNHPEYKAKFNKEVVPLMDEYTWEMEVIRDNNQQPILLSWDNKAFGDNEKQLYLVDLTTLHVIDMRSQNQTKIGKGTSKLMIIFGKQKYIDLQLTKVISALGEPYPNPTNGSIAVPFNVTNNNTMVLLRVFDHSGKQIGKHNEIYSSGIHQLNWKFDLPGIYLVQIQMGEAISTKKIVVK